MKKIFMSIMVLLCLCIVGFGANVSGTVLDSSSNPLGGVVMTLTTGSTSRIITTSASGQFNFNSVTTNVSYSLRPELVNYSFYLTVINFFQGSSSTTGLDFLGTQTSSGVSPLNTAEFFVRQQYLDLLLHEPDESGLNFWSSNLKACTTQACRNTERRNIMCAFITSGEYQARFGGSITVCQ